MVLKNGDRVLIKANGYSSSYKGRYIGSPGTIENYTRDYGGRVPVRLLYCDNPSSKYGLFYFNMTEIDPLVSTKSVENLFERGNNMANPAGYSRVAVIAANGVYVDKMYHYALYDNDIKIGDKVLVTGVARDKVLTIKDILDADERTTFKKITEEVICKIDTTDYDNRVEKRELSTKLRQQLAIKKQEIESRKDDDYYASLDPEYAQILLQLRSLSV